MPVRPMSREQSWLLPPSLDELLPDNHPSRFVAAFVEGLDRAHWSEMGIDLGGDAMGAPSYHPKLLLCAWLYGFMRGIRSSRKIEEACRDQIPFLWLTGFQHPDTISVERLLDRSTRLCPSACLWYTLRKQDRLCTRFGKLCTDVSDLGSFHSYFECHERSASDLGDTCSCLWSDRT